MATTRTANIFWITFFVCALLLFAGLGFTFVYLVIAFRSPSDPLWPFVVAIAAFLSLAGMSFLAVRKRIQT